MPLSVQKYYWTKVAIRLDFAEFDCKPIITEDGMLLAPARFARDGVLEYQTPDGRTRRELRPPEENKKAIAEFGLLPVTIEHSHGLVNQDNADDARKGLTLQNVRYEVVKGKGGFVTGHIAVFDSKAKQFLQSGNKCQLSHGYRCRLEETPGRWLNPATGMYENYDAIQRDIKGNHVALTDAGRAGPDCAVKMDSLIGEGDEDIAYSVDVFDSKAIFSEVSHQEEKRRMATLKIGSATYEAPENLVTVVAPKLDRLDSLEDLVPTLEQQVSEQEVELTRTQSRADAAEFVLGNAEEILEGLGYIRDNQGFYHKTDAAKSKCDECGKNMDSDEEDEDEDEEAVEEATPFNKQKKGKGKPSMDKKKDGAMYKKDAEDEGGDRSDSLRTDSVKDLLIAYKEADSLVPAVDGKAFSELHLDSLSTVAEIHRKIVEELAPKHFPSFKLDGKSAEQIEVAYELIKDTLSQEKTDSSKGAGDRHDSSYSLEMTKLVGESRRASASKGSPLDEAQSKSSEQLANAWQQPLSLSR